MPKKIIIIGAGLGGLSTAIYARRKGFEVVVIEQQSRAGGKAGQLKMQTKKGQFCFDTGPSLLTMPEVFQDLGLDLKQDLELVKLPESTRYFFPDSACKHPSMDINSKRFIAYTQPDKFRAEFARLFQDSFQSWQKFKDKVEFIWDKGAKVFLYHQLDWSLLKTKIFWQNLIFLLFISSFVTLNQLSKKYFQDPRLIQIINRLGTYNGSNPYQMPGTFACISQPEFFRDLYLPKNGIYQIPDKIYHKAKQMGVKFVFNQSLEKVEFKGSIAPAPLKGGELTPDILEGENTFLASFRKGNTPLLLPRGKSSLGVISSIQTKDKVSQEVFEYRDFDDLVLNFDPLTFYDKFLDEKQKKPYQKLYKQAKSSSGVVFYWAIEAEFETLGLHNILFSSDYQLEFEQIFKQQIVPSDPTIYINISSKVLKNQAPAGCENWFVMVNVPSRLDLDWQQEVAKLKQKVLEKIRQELGLDIAKLILKEEVLTPKTLYQKTGSHQGSLYGFNSNSIFSLLKRPSLKDPKIPNLYFCGGTVHPGGGMPLAVLSGKGLVNCEL